jgi:hypothetical protein
VGSWGTYTISPWGKKGIYELTNDIGSPYSENDGQHMLSPVLTLKEVLCLRSDIVNERPQLRCRHEYGPEENTERR